MAEQSKPDFSYIWASGGAVVAPSNVKIQTGWTAEVPPFQWENYVQNRQDQALVHILQHGISVWDPLTEYQAGKSYVQGSDGVIYKAKITITNQNPVTDVSSTYWSKSFNTGTLLNVQTITASGTVTKTPGATKWRVRGVGAGGAGGGTPATSSTQASGGGGGGAGAYGEGLYDVSSITSVSAVVAAGAVGVVGGIGNTGGTSTLGGFMTLPGGVGGNIGPATSLLPNDGGSGAVAGSSPTGANIVGFAGNGGGTSQLFSTAGALGGKGGPSVLGGTSVQTNATGYGAGGYGRGAIASNSALAGFSGGRAVFIIEEYS